MEHIKKLYDEGKFTEIDELINRLDKNTNEHYYMIGLYNYLKKDYKTAFENMMICHTNMPSNLEYLAKLIEICYYGKDYGKTLQFCGKYNELSDNNSVLYTMAKTYYLIRKFSESAKILEKCISRGYDLEKVTDELVMCYYNLADKQRILHYTDQILNLPNLKDDRRLIHIMMNKLYIDNNLISEEHMDGERKIFDEGIDYFMNSNYKIKSLDEFVLPWSAKLGFPLSYQHKNNKDILIKLSQMYRKMCPELSYVAEHCVNPDRTTKRKLRVGFISAFFRNHSVSKDRRGIMKLLSREQYDVYSLFLNNTYDNISDEIKKSTIPIILSTSMYEARKQIEELKLDILIYCEIGMFMPTYLLAHFRLAPVQINTWGHSDTSGIDSIDYFISSKLYELENAQNHYSEKLILNDSLCTFYYNPLKYVTEVKPLPQVIDRLDPTKYNIYICPGSLIKLHPNMNIIIDKLLKKDSKAYIVMISDDVHTKDFEARLKEIIHDNIVRIAFISAKYDNNYFFGLLASGKVILDTYPFGGCNTCLESFSIGKPVVTLPGTYINGRFTYGFYQKMKFTELIAEDYDNYVDIAYRVANDDEYRKYVTEQINLRSSILYENVESVYEWNLMLNDLYYEK